MSFLSALLYLAAAVFLGGMAWRLLKWKRASVPLKIVLTPAPTTATGVARRLAGEIIGFRSLFTANRLFWIPAWLFHVLLLLLLVGHVAGLIVAKQAESILGLTEPQFERFAQLGGATVGALAFAAVLALLIWRFASERSSYISTLSDYFGLCLLAVVIATGNQMRLMNQLDIIQARAFVHGWFAFHPVPPPNDPVFAAHVLLVSALLIFIPFSKLVHIGGAALFNPALNQLNNARDRRHLHEHAAH
jgi:nitrate reductase gamma subunit